MGNARSFLLTAYCRGTANCHEVNYVLACVPPLPQEAPSRSWLLHMRIAQGTLYLKEHSERPLVDLIHSIS